MQGRETSVYFNLKKRGRLVIMKISAQTVYVGIDVGAKERVMVIRNNDNASAPQTYI